MARVDKKQFRSVWTVLVSLAFATKPLTIDEMINILRVDPRAKPPTKAINIYHKKLLIFCSSLVFTFSAAALDRESQRLGSPKIHLRLAHLSVKEYLVSEEIKQSAVAAFEISHGLGNRVMAELCLGCLLQNDNVLQFGRQTLEAYPFTLYAAENWEKHASEANGEENGRDLIDHLFLEFLNGHTPDPYVNCARAAGGNMLVSTTVADILFKPPWFQDAKYVSRRVDEPGPIPGSTHATALRSLITHSELQAEFRTLVKPFLLSYATSLNLWRTVKTLLHTQCTTADNLDQAMHEGLRTHAYDSLEVLVTHGKANVNSRDTETGRTLLERCETPSAARWLVAHGAALQPDPHFCPALHTFCHKRAVIRDGDPAGFSTAMVATLLELGADANTVFETRCSGGAWLSTPLQIAAYRGNIGVVRALLKHGADVHRVEGRIGSSLYAAALGGWNGVVKLLLSKGADIHAVSGIYGSVLLAAGHGARRDNVKTCFQQGACWDDFIDASLENVRGHPWKTLDHETQEYLVAQIIRVSHERHGNLAERVREGFMTLDGAIELARRFGLGNEDTKALRFRQSQNVYMQTLEALEKYTSQGPIESNYMDRNSLGLTEKEQRRRCWLDD